MTAASPPLAPWRSMWVRPRATIRQILETDPTRHIALLAVLSGILSSFNSAINRSLGDRIAFPAVIVMCIAFGALGGYISLHISAAVLAWMGRKLGGRGQAQDVRAAIAWAAIPRIWGGSLLVPELLIFGEELFTTATPRIDSNPALLALLLGFGLIELVIGVWSTVVFLRSLGEAHGFSAWRALGTVILSSLLVLLPILCIVAGIGVLTLLGSRA